MKKIKIHIKVVIMSKNKKFMFSCGQIFCAQSLLKKKKYEKNEISLLYKFG